MRIYCVCQCGEHTEEEATIEINFSDECIYFLCPKCRKENKVTLKPPDNSLPRIRLK